MPPATQAFCFCLHSLNNLKRVGGRLGIIRASKLAWQTLSLLGLLWLPALHASQATVAIDTGKPGPRLNPRMYGIFLEEINHGVDGGLYGELIRNRGFEDAKAPEGFVFTNGHWNNGRGYVIPYHFEVDKSLPYWSLLKEGDAQGSMSLDLENPLNSTTPRSCRVEVTHLSSGRLAIANEGYWGIATKEGEEYLLSFWARSNPGFTGPLQVLLEDAQGSALTQTQTIPVVGEQWKCYKTTLIAHRSEPQGRFVLSVGSVGTVWLDMVSLFPKHTFKQRPNGLRADIAQMLADLKPGFVRFPGGCVVEGATPENAYDWKKSIGPLEQREEIWNVWDYRRTHGMGFLEYLQFIEDIGADPLYVGFAGQTCIYRHATNLPLEQMPGIEQSFLDALEFANGSPETEWGRLRAASGHPEPFHLKMLEIGNENVGRQYEQRYALIYPKIKSKYPDVTALACFPQPQQKTEMVDEHYYNSPRWFINNFNLYDRRDRHSPPVYIAEVAVTSQEGGRDKGNLAAALAEGVFLMGAERNADVVRMVSYAPLLANVHGRTELAGAPPPWHGMIYFDSSRVCGTVSYYLWQLLGLNRPTFTLATDVTVDSGEPAAITGSIGVGTWQTGAEFKDISVEKDGKELYASDFTKGSDGWTNESGSWSVTNGVYRQKNPMVGLSYFGDESWSDYTVNLKARKLRGDEGFLVIFGRKGRDKYWWNVGGWGNTEHAIEFNQNTVGRHIEGSVELNRWYAVRVELKGRRIRCFLDGQLIHDELAPVPRNFFALGGRDEDTGDISIKVANVSPQPVQATLRFTSQDHFAGSLQETVLTSTHLTDNNSLDNPTRVVPRSTSANVDSPQLIREFPPNSFTLLKLKTR